MCDTMTSVFLHVMYATATFWQVLCHIMGLGWESKVPQIVLCSLFAHDSFG